MDQKMYIGEYTCIMKYPVYVYFIQIWDWRELNMGKYC